MPETLEVTYPGPSVSEAAKAEAAAAKAGEIVFFSARLDIGPVAGDQKIPRETAEILLAAGTVKRTNPPAKPKPAPATIPAPAPAPQE